MNLSCNKKSQTKPKKYLFNYIYLNLVSNLIQTVFLIPQKSKKQLSFSQAASFIIASNICLPECNYRKELLLIMKGVHIQKEHQPSFFLQLILLI